MVGILCGLGSMASAFNIVCVIRVAAVAARKIMAPVD